MPQRIYIDPETPEDGAVRLPADEAEAQRWERWRRLDDPAFAGRNVFVVDFRVTIPFPVPMTDFGRGKTIANALRAYIVGIEDGHTSPAGEHAPFRLDVPGRDYETIASVLEWAVRRDDFPSRPNHLVACLPEVGATDPVPEPVLGRIRFRYDRSDGKSEGIDERGDLVVRPGRWKIELIE